MLPRSKMACFRILVWIILYFDLLHILHVSSASPKSFFKRYEKDLLDDLLTNYSAYYRPTTSNNDSVIVEFDFKLSKIVKLDIKEQVMIVNSKITLKWRDPQLSWDRSKWNQTMYIITPAKLIWTPDIMLYNTAEETSQATSDIFKAKALIDSKGNVIWTSPATLKASCGTNIKWFPFDTQKCKLTFGSLAYAKSRLEIRFMKKPGSTAAVKGSMHYSSGDWDMKSLTSTVRDQELECCPDSYSLIEYEFTLKRLYTYYMIYLVLPCLCLIFMAPCMFLIPPESGERTGFGVTVVLALSVYLLVISDKLPEKSDRTPLIGVLYTVMFFLLVLALFAGIVVTHLVFKTSKPPKWLWRFLFKRKKFKKKLININDNKVTEVTDKEAVAMSYIDRPSVKSIATIPSIDEEEKNRQKWRAIGVKVDKILMYLYLALAFIAPCIVIISFYASE